MVPGQLWEEGDGGVRRVSLVRLSREIAQSLAVVGRVAVEGEVVRPKHHPGGTYFTLRDRAVQVSVRCPASRSNRCRAIAGERVLVTATPSWEPERGQLQLLAEEVVPVGEGAIAAAISERRARLAADGLLHRPRRAIPRLPTVIGVVCGSEAAVREDIDSVVAARFPGYPVSYRITAVAGPGAADAVIDALRSLDARPEVEVILLARGGGDAAQLLPFSDEALCRAICETGTPVVSAIGHDGDRPLCDDVADLRFGTPSLAAAALVPSRADLDAQLARLDADAHAVLGRRLADAAGRLAGLRPDASLEARLAGARGALANVVDRLSLVAPDRSIALARARLARIDWHGPLARRLAREQERVHAHDRHLRALSPERVLERGYAVVRTGDGTVIRRADSTAPGQTVDVQLAAGRLEALVERVRP
jgi:exodeoxyribonuclease VII large subunit